MLRFGSVCKLLGPATPAAPPLTRRCFAAFARWVPTAAPTQSNLLFRPQRWLSKKSKVGEREGIPGRVLAQLRKESLNQLELSDGDKKAIALTRLWVKDWVIRHRLCPWAASVFSEAALRVKVINADFESPEGQEEMIYLILAECVRLSHSLAAGGPHKTTLLVLPSLKSFDAFLELHRLVEDMLPTAEDGAAAEKIQLDELLQVATFHPRYIFAESQQLQAPENYTNRSPFPMLHLLSARDVAAALGSIAGDPHDVWRRNIDLMRSIGRPKILQELRAIVQRGLAGAGQSATGAPNVDVDDEPEAEPEAPQPPPKAPRGSRRQD